MDKHVAMDRELDRVVVLTGARFVLEKYRELRNSGLGIDEAKRKANETLNG